MRRFVVLVLILAIVSTVFVVAQAPQQPQGGLPGLPPAAQRPGLPPRDNAQAPQTGTSRIVGRVATQGGMPLRRAQVTLTSSEGPQPLRRMTTTDAEGRYRFEQLPAGRFALAASKAGYVGLQFGQRRPNEAGTPVSLTDGQAAEKIDFSLPRGSVIVARVTDEFGEPLAGVTVQVQRYQYGPDGQRRLQSVNTGSGTPFTATDDLGDIRLFGLMPGEYVITASMRTLGSAFSTNASDSADGFAPTFYPGTLSADEAEAISLGIGEERVLQFAMTPGRLGRVSGMVVDAEGRPVAGAQLTLVTTTGSGYSSSGVGQSAANGTFTVNGIPPGAHSIEASLRRAGIPGLSARVPIVVAADDITGLQIALGQGAVVSGTVVYDGTAPRTGTSPVTPRVSAQRTDQQFSPLPFGATDPAANGEIDEKGAFKLGGLSGRVLLNVSVPTGWAIRSISAGGEDVTEVPLELANGATVNDVRIVLTDKVTSVSGRVTAGDGRERKDYVVVVLPAADRTLEPIVASGRTRLVRPDTNGRFEVRGLRPGRYVATALESIEQGRQFAPEFQERLRQKSRAFSLREGQSATLDLELTVGLE